MSQLRVTVCIVLFVWMPALVSAQSFYLPDQPASKAKMSLTFFHPMF